MKNEKRLQEVRLITDGKKWKEFIIKLFINQSKKTVWSYKKWHLWHHSWLEKMFSLAFRTPIVKFLNSIDHKFILTLTRQKNNKIYKLTDKPRKNLSILLKKMWFWAPLSSVHTSLFYIQYNKIIISIWFDSYHYKKGVSKSFDWVEIWV